MKKIFEELMKIAMANGEIQTKPDYRQVQVLIELCVMGGEAIAWK